MNDNLDQVNCLKFFILAHDNIIQKWLNMALTKEVQYSKILKLWKCSTMGNLTRDLLKTGPS